MTRQNSKSPPSSGFASLKPELHVNDLEASLSFWVDVLEFEIAYQRQEELFVYLESPNGAQVMLCQRHGGYETGPMEKPLGQGVMFQIDMTDLDAVEKRLQERNWPIYAGPREVWRELGDRLGGQREIFVQDPDGYLLMLAKAMGTRELPDTKLK